MQLLQAHSPEEYERLFCQQVGLERREMPDGSTLWRDPTGTTPDYIRQFGSLDTVRCGLGDYTTRSDFLASLDYEFCYLHFGIVYQGITYWVADGEVVAGESPSAFVGLDRSPVGMYHWRAGQHFKGAEVSIEMDHLRTRVLPYLGLSDEALDYIQPGVRLTHLSVELMGVLQRFELAMKSEALTPSLQAALAAEFVALLARPDVREELLREEGPAAQTLRVGERNLLVTSEDFRKVEQVRRRIAREACTFPTIRTLAHDAGLSEQKLKAAFQRQYQQTLWDYANSVRMSEAARLLRDTDRPVAEVSAQTGYQSQAAFTAMFKKWTGMTPHQFRTQSHQARGRGRRG